MIIDTLSQFRPNSIAMARCLALAALLAAASCVLLAVCPSEVHRVEQMPRDWVKKWEKKLGSTVMRMRVIDGDE